jgi:AraC family transcriptional regulator, transcriptional activator of pobA
VLDCDVVFLDGMGAQLQIKDKSENNRFLKAEAFRKGTRKTDPHKHNGYFELVYLSAGRGNHSIDNHRFEVRPPVLFFIRQDQVHHWDLDEGAEPEGWVLILKKIFFDQSLDGELKDLLEKVSQSSCIYLQDAAVIDQLLGLIVREHAREEVGSLLFAEGLLKGIFVKVLEAIRPAADHGKQRKELYRAFMQLLLHERPLRNKVAYYAALLNTTPQNLNAVCRKAADRAAADVLADYMIDEAKRLLVYTDSTVAEVSFILSFKDPSHFVKYFKRHTSYTPKGFRAIRG